MTLERGSITGIQMDLQDLDFNYPEELVATEPNRNYRTLLHEGSQVKEISPQQVLELFNRGDVLVINDTQVVKRRIFSEDQVEVLFLKPLGEQTWEVLFPARKFKVGQSLHLPDFIKMTLEDKGLPQRVKVSRELTDQYFMDHGELPLPPYIQKARERRHNVLADDQWYQTAWARNAGSFAAPTASLHFSNKDLENLKEKGVLIEKVTLHVGLGTFLPIKGTSLEEHKMHSEECFLPLKTLQTIEQAQDRGNRVFALGTTVARTLESWKKGYLQPAKEGGLRGETDIFIRPGFQFECVDVLMTNFHQPQSTLLALVAAFTGLDEVKRAYEWAIERRFQLFSYGDFSIWIR